MTQQVVTQCGLFSCFANVEVPPEMTQVVNKHLCTSSRLSFSQYLFSQMRPSGLLSKSSDTTKSKYNLFVYVYRIYYLNLHSNTNVILSDTFCGVKCAIFASKSSEVEVA